MLDFLGTVLLTAAILVIINVLVSTMRLRPAAKLSIAAIAGLWIGFQVAFANSGVLAGQSFGPVPPVGVIVLTPLVVTALLAALLPAFRGALLAIPTPVLVGLNTGRIFGAFFLFLAAQNRLGGPFPYVAGWGDVITAVVALPVAVMIARGGGENSSIPLYWNIFGALDLVVAVALGVMSANGSPVQIFFPPITGPSPLTGLPWSLIPTVLVPFYLIVHGILFVQLRRTGIHRATGSMAQAA